MDAAVQITLCLLEAVVQITEAFLYLPSQELDLMILFVET
jgi:hypothetical protein